MNTIDLLSKKLQELKSLEMFVVKILHLIFTVEHNCCHKKIGIVLLVFLCLEEIINFNIGLLKLIRKYFSIYLDSWSNFQKLH